MSRFLSERLRGHRPYVPGEQPQDRSYVKLNTNESPFPPLPAVGEAAKREALSSNLYSDPDCRVLRERFAQRMGVAPENVLLTNGSDEGLQFIVMAYGDASHPIAFCDVTYGLYPVLCSLYQVPCEILPLREDFSVDREACIRTGNTLILANPNAPTGIAMSRDETEAIIASRPDRLVTVDEAYVDFGAQSCVPLTEKNDNLLVVGTFSKARSLAGARLGYVIGNRELIGELDGIRRSLNPYNVNRMTLAAGIAVLEEDEKYMENCRVIVRNREWTAERLAGQGFRVLPSSANFLFASHPALSGRDLYLRLKERGILVRYFSSARTAPYVRITVGTLEQMKILTEAIENIVREAI